jgi:hypothetical protein
MEPRKTREETMKISAFICLLVVLISATIVSAQNISGDVREK